MRLQVNVTAPHGRTDLSLLLNSLSLVPQLRLFLLHTDLGWQRLDVLRAVPNKTKKTTRFGLAVFTSTDLLFLGGKLSVKTGIKRFVHASDVEQLRKLKAA